MTWARRNSARQCAELGGPGLGGWCRKLEGPGWTSSSAAVCGLLLRVSGRSSHKFKKARPQKNKLKKAQTLNMPAYSKDQTLVEKGSLVPVGKGL
jgi:hypothetical protein